MLRKARLPLKGTARGPFLFAFGIPDMRFTCIKIDPMLCPGTQKVDLVQRAWEGALEGSRERVRGSNEGPGVGGSFVLVPVLYYDRPRGGPGEAGLGWGSTRRKSRLVDIDAHSMCSHSRVNTYNIARNGVWENQSRV